MKNVIILALLCATISSAQDIRKTHTFFLQAGVDPAVALNLKKDDGTERPGGGRLNYTINGGVILPTGLDYLQWSPSIEVESFEAINFFSIGGRFDFIFPIFKIFDVVTGIELVRISRWNPEGARKTAYDTTGFYSLGVNAGIRYTYKKHLFVTLNGNYSSAPDEHYHYHNHEDPMKYRYSNTVSVGVYF